MFAVVGKIDQGFEDESFKPFYGDNVADENALDEDAILDAIDNPEQEV